MPGQAPLEGGDRKLGAAAFDLRREVEADRFRIGRRLRKTLAAQPRGEHFPVRGVGALGVVGLGGAGVGLGGLRERRQAAAEAPGGREQGRGVRAGSLGLKRRAFRLSAIRAVPDAFVRTALRVGWRAGVGRGGAAVGADRRGQGGGAWRGDLVPPGLPGPWRGACAPPGLRCRARTRRCGPASPRSPLRRRRRTRAGQRRAPPPVGLRPVAIRRLGAVPGVSGRAPLRVRWPRGLGCGRPQARAKPGERGRGTARSSRRRPRFPTPRRRQKRSPQSVFGTLRGAHRAEFRGVCHGVCGAPSESCPIRQAYRTSPPHDKRGGLLREIA